MEFPAKIEEFLQFLTQFHPVMCILTPELHNMIICFVQKIQVILIKCSWLHDNYFSNFNRQMTNATMKTITGDIFKLCFVCVSMYFFSLGTDVNFDILLTIIC